MKDLRMSNVKFQMSNVKSKFIGNCKLQIRNWKFQRAFTLIELIVVITIIAILISAISISWAKAQQKGRDARRKSDLKAVQQSLDTFYETTGAYPQDDFSGNITCSTNTGATELYDASTLGWGFPFVCTQTSSGQADTFLQPLPKDPVYQSTAGYYYQRTKLDGTADPFHYVLETQLENTSDPDISSCPNSRNYCITNP